MNVRFVLAKFSEIPAGGDFTDLAHSQLFKKALIPTADVNAVKLPQGELTKVDDGIEVHPVLVDVTVKE